MSRKFFSLEDAELSMGDEGQLEASDVQELADGVQETQVDAAEIDEVASAIEDAEVAVDNLEESSDILEAGVESGEGVSEETAKAVDVAVEAALNMLGASHRQRSLLPSLESWGAGASRLSSTTFAIESIGDKIKEIWKKIVEFVKMIAQKVVDFFAKFFDNADRLKKNVGKLRAKVNEAGSNSKVKEANIKNGTVTKAFNNGEGKSDFSTASAIINNHIDLSGAASALVNSMSQVVAGAQEALNGKSVDFKQRVGSALGSVKGNAGFSPYSDAEKKREGVKSGAMLGGITLEIGFETGETVTSADGTASTPVSVVFETNEPAKKSTKEAATLTPKESLDLLSSVEKLADATNEYKKIKGTIEGMVKQTAKLADIAVKSADENGSAAGLRKVVTSVARTLSRFATMMPSMNVRAGNAALSYVQSSISNWEKSGDKK